MSALLKQLFCVEENGVSRISVTKVGANVKMVSGAIAAMAGTAATQGWVKVAGILGSVAAGLALVGVGVGEIGKRNSSQK
jgi:hypothetical protein